MSDWVYKTSYHSCLEVRIQPGGLQPFGWPATAQGSHSTEPNPHRNPCANSRALTLRRLGALKLWGGGFWLLSDSQTFLFIAPVQARDTVMDICKIEWLFPTL